jgi:hypothetical protein
MSTVTGPYEWSNLYNAVGSGDDPWTNVSNMLTDTGTAATSNSLAGYPDYEITDAVYFYNWQGRSFIPNNAVIENITIDGSAQSGATYWAYYQSGKFRIAFPGNVKSDSLEVGIDLSGDLTYWGVSNAQALTSILATSYSFGNMQFYVQSGQNSYTMGIKRMRMTVTWSEAPPGGAIQLGSFG